MESMTLKLLAGALALLLLYVISAHTYWKRRGIPMHEGFVPLFGHFLPIYTLPMTMGKYFQKMYNDCKQHSMFGIYDMFNPILVVREPQLVKTILQSNFSSFHKNGWELVSDVDPLLHKNPFFSEGEQWMTGRKRLTYAFSSMRLKILFQAVAGVGKKLEDFLSRQLKTKEKYEVELTEFFGRFTAESVANAGLGIEGYSFDDNPPPNSFQELGKETFEQSSVNGLLRNVLFFKPCINRFFRVPFMPKHVDKFFRQVVEENLQMRANADTARNDFFQTIFDLAKANGEEPNTEDLASHALSFFADGFETSRITLSFAAYQLAKHPDIQQKVRDEVKSTIAKHGGVLTYEATKELTYMEQVISESQRLNPVLGFFRKRCTEKIELIGSDGLRVWVQPGTDVLISVDGLQMNPDYWSDPEEFDPDRFSEERKRSIEKMSFIPFGDGPRICVGMRMAMVVMKHCLATLLDNYKIELSPKTQLPLQMSTFFFINRPTEGIWSYISKL
ncbi:PREDICTED: cytochrome P450 6g1-like [Dufourea novaeangliae]|uniref:Putative cytochrome P450 6a14 n=1 Tax=Dufourea novaeangliae TaxID=178035 RepID=A0A154PL28_DUFNO|nr:PREDICTED: cytochrome P450 6g1-like [Dufourea novaeangliae]KZC12581.1 putative cytochrome P450 6a14 [Dufourea novaeangliae]